MAVLGCLAIKVKTSIVAVALRREEFDYFRRQMFAAVQRQRDRTNAHVVGRAILNAGL